MNDMEERHDRREAGWYVTRPEHEDLKQRVKDVDDKVDRVDGRVDHQWGIMLTTLGAAVVAALAAILDLVTRH